MNTRPSMFRCGVICLVAALFGGVPLAMAQDAPTAPNPSTDALQTARTAFTEAPTVSNKYRLIDVLRLEANTRGDATFMKEALVLACTAPAVDSAEIALLADHYRNMALQDRQKAFLAQLDDPDTIPTDLTAESILCATGDMGLTAKLCRVRGDTARADALTIIQDVQFNRLSAEVALDTAEWLAPLIPDAPLHLRPALQQDLLQLYQRYLLSADPQTPAYRKTQDALLTLFTPADPDSHDPTNVPIGQWVDLVNALTLEGDPNANAWTLDPTTGCLSAGKNTVLGWFPLIFQNAEYDLHLRVQQFSKRTTLELWFPMGDQTGLLSMGPRGCLLNNKAVQSSPVTDLAAHTITLRVRRHADGQFAASADFDGVEVFTPAPLKDSMESRLAPAHRPLAAHHLLLRARSGACELQTVSLNLITGQASVPTEKQPQAASQETRQVTVGANESWPWIMQVRPGDVLRIMADGLWSPIEGVTIGPEGDDFGWYALHGRLVESEHTFDVGAQTTIFVQRDDVLKLEMDDTNKADNSGVMNVTIHRYTATTPSDIMNTGSARVNEFDAPLDLTPEEDLSLLFGTGPYTPEQARHMLLLATSIGDADLQSLLLKIGVQQLLRAGDPLPAAAIPLVIRLTPEQFDSAADVIIAQCQAVLQTEEAPHAAAALRAAGDHALHQRQWDRAQTCLTGLPHYAEQEAARKALIDECLATEARWLQNPDAQAPYVAALLTANSRTDDLAFSDDTKELLSLIDVGYDTLQADDALQLAQWLEQIAATSSGATRLTLRQQVRQYCSEALAACDPTSETGLAAKALDTKTADALRAAMATPDAAQAVPETIPALGRQRWGQFTISSRMPWQKTLKLTPGDHVTIDANGIWSLAFGGGQQYIVGPEGKVLTTGDERTGNLLYRIGNSPQQHAGAHRKLQPDSEGMLEFQVNDANLSDNVGSATVTISITPAPAE